MLRELVKFTSGCVYEGVSKGDCHMSRTGVDEEGSSSKRGNSTQFIGK